MKSLNIVIIGQWIYPMLNPRSHRTWQLAINFAKMGHNVTVYALLGKSDYSEYEQKYNIKIRSLGKSYFGCINSDGVGRNLFCKILIKLFRSHFMYPDIELVRLTNRALSKIEIDVDLLISIASPHMIHWGVSKGLPSSKVKYWIADCGDPFMLNPFSTPNKRFEKKERDWCSKANAILVPIEEAKTAYYSEYRDKIHVVPQGFDFSNIKLATYVSNPIPTFAFSGLVYPKHRDPEKFLKYLSSLDINFKFIVYTKVRKYFEPYATELRDKIEFRDFIPREQLIFELSQMDFLINIENFGTVQQPSKLIDYAQTKRPILSISSEFSDKEKIKFEEFLLGNYQNQLSVDNVAKYDINNICEKILLIAK